MENEQEEQRKPDFPGAYVCQVIQTTLVRDEPDSSGRREHVTQYWTLDGCQVGVGIGYHRAIVSRKNDEMDVFSLKAEMLESQVRRLTKKLKKKGEKETRGKKGAKA